jgi:N utilization substance protein A
LFPALPPEHQEVPTVARKKKMPEVRALNVKPLIRMIAKEKDLEPERIKWAIETAILSAAQKRNHHFNEPRPHVDVETGDLRIFVKKQVVINVDDETNQIDILAAKARNPDHMLGDMIEVEIDPEEFGRIAAQSVRQGILQRLRDAERDNVYEEYKDRVGSVVTAIVQRYERRDAIVALGKVECLMPFHEIPMGVRYRYGDRIRVLIIDVRRTPKGPQVVVSRTRSELVKQLFAMEVPEIHDGTVRIVEIAREPGIRTKIAVNSMNPDVDPVGACVGVKGTRVQMIVRELDNEKVDIVPYSAIPENFISSALNPAKIVHIKLDEIQKRAFVVVERDSLAKAIGKRGQNAKLAAKLTGWKIDVAEQEDAEELARMEEISRRYLADFLAQIEGLSEFSRDALVRADGFNTVEKLAEMNPEQLLSFTNEDQELAEEIVEGAKEYLQGLEEMTENSESGMSEELRQQLKNASELADRLAGKIISVTPDDVSDAAEGGLPPAPAEGEEPTADDEAEAEPAEAAAEEAAADAAASPEEAPVPTPEADEPKPE